MNETDQRRSVSTSSDQRRVCDDVIVCWSMYVQNITEEEDTIIVSDIAAVDDLIAVTYTPVTIGDYDDDIDR